MIKADIGPVGGGVAIFTHAVRADMVARFSLSYDTGMTCGALIGCSGEGAIHMTAFTINSAVGTF
jgi:hypothetical protein